MSTTVILMSDEGRKTLIAHAGKYLAPMCFVFAIAVAEGTGAQLFCVRFEGKIVHAGVVGKKNRYRDVRGDVTPAEFVLPFVSGGGFSIEATTREVLEEYSERVNNEKRLFQGRVFFFLLFSRSFTFFWVC